MRLAFAGTPEFAAIALGAILDAGSPVDLVLTKPDRPQGRGLRPLPSAVKRLSVERGLAVRQPPSLRDAGARADIVSHPVDLLVVAAYGLLLPPEILSWPRYGCINIHASLLPRWRGAAPIERALLAGDRQTGISIMQMDAGLDTGPVIATYPVAIARDETGGSLHDKLAAKGASAIVAVLATLAKHGALESRPQPDAGVTYAPKIERTEARIDWREDAVQIERRVRTFDPSPGAVTTLGGMDIKVWQAEAVAGRPGTPGTVIKADATGIVVACGEGALILQSLQRAGGRKLPVASFLAGHPLAAGQKFE